SERPRLSIQRSIKNLNAQLVDDRKGHTVFALSTLSSLLKDKAVSWGSVKGAAIFGEVFAEEAGKKGFSNVIFDRGGYLYHGRIKAFADACRRKGLKF
ncbi:MAG: 50S ribosomal protein L18, partial [Candidatus Omnitrophica bacterium]|nr:50S ribosomal protein L18 [Candidatus Omnitrophota bacterium]